MMPLNERLFHVQFYCIAQELSKQSAHEFEAGDILRCWKSGCWCSSAAHRHFDFRGQMVWVEHLQFVLYVSMSYKSYAHDIFDS